MGHRLQLWALLAALFPVLAIGAGADGDGHARASGLRCEYQKNPIGIGEASPRLMWVVEAARRDEVQSAYRVLVASTPEGLARDQGDLWDTGKVDGNVVQAAYAGRALGSRQACWWKVMVWDRDKQAGPWSEAARFEMGLLAPADWAAKWIEAGATTTGVEITSATYYTPKGNVRKDVTAEVRAMVAKGGPVVASNAALGGDPAYNSVKRLAIEYRVDNVPLHTEVAENGTARLVTSRLPYLRRAFTVEKPVKQARLYATALGMAELRINGELVDDSVFEPGWTDYRKRVNYRVYDVTARVQHGANAIGAMVGPGWFAGRAGLFHATAFYGSTPALLCQLEITYEDGSVARIVSDESWKRHDGPLVAADIMDGEIHDARREVAGWAAASVDERDWTPVTTRAETRNLESTIAPPMRTLAELPAKSVTEPASGRWTFDVGQNMVGVVRLKLNGKAGQIVTIRHGEMLNPDGTIYTGNLRGAAATDVYVCRGGDETWQPRFTFHGFRYVEVTGLEAKPDAGMVTGIVLGSALPETGTFSCSDASLNQLQSNIVWGMHGNYLSIPTDCPQRDERMGWMADAQVFAPTAAFNADIAGFMTKWMIDVDDAQRADGAHSDVAPVMKGLTFGTPAWADAGTIVPWTIYQMYDDTRILERHIESMKRWVDWCKANSTGLIRDHNRGNDYGDWLSIGADTPKDLIGTAYFARSTDIVARSLRALKRDDEAAVYEKLWKEIRDAFNAKYVSADGHVAGNTQCGYVLGLRFNLLPEELRGKAADLLVADIEAKGWHLSTGFVGVSNLLPVLADAGRADVAYKLLMQDSFPSWLFSVKHGATTIWERWNGWTPETGPHPDDTMNSFNHYSLGSCGQWLFEGVGGIRPELAAPGFASFRIEPLVDGPLTEAKTSLESIRGPISTQWSRGASGTTIRVKIPANTTATVVLPRRHSAWTESGRGVQGAEGVHSVKSDAGAMVIEVGSGEYVFANADAAP